MTVHIALLRAVNVGGRGALAMQDLAALCTSLGLNRVRTYIQSGNVVFESKKDEAGLCRSLAAGLRTMTGQDIGVLVRTAAELEAVRDANPYPAADPARVAVVFLPATLPADAFLGVTTPGGEELRCIGRVLFIHYPDGIGRSKLRLPSGAAAGTARNMNTVTKLIAMAAEVAKEPPSTPVPTR